MSLSPSRFRFDPAPVLDDFVVPLSPALVDSDSVEAGDSDPVAVAGVESSVDGVSVFVALEADTGAATEAGAGSDTAPTTVEPPGSFGTFAAS